MQKQGRQQVFHSYLRILLRDDDDRDSKSDVGFLKVLFACWRGLKSPRYGPHGIALLDAILGHMYTTTSPMVPAVVNQGLGKNS